MSFKVEHEAYHLGGGLCYRACEFEPVGVVGKLGSVVREYVAQSEAEAQLGDELEVGQVEVAAYAYRDVEVGGGELEDVVALLGYVERGHHAAEYVWAGVAGAHGGELEVEGQGDVGRFDVLALFGAGVEFEEADVAAAEHHAGCESQREIVVEAQGGEACDGESGLIVDLLGTPFLAAVGDETVVCEAGVHGVHAHGESEVPAAHVGVGAVLDLVVEASGCGGQGAGRYDRYN